MGDKMDRAQPTSHEDTQFPEVSRRSSPPPSRGRRAPNPDRGPDQADHRAPAGGRWETRWTETGPPTGGRLAPRPAGTRPAPRGRGPPPWSSGAASGGARQSSEKSNSFFAAS